MDILFINSISLLENDHFAPQLGQITLATILRNKGWHADLLDFDLMYHNKQLQFYNTAEKNINAMADVIIKKAPKIVSFYTMCNSYPTVLKIVEKIRLQNANIKIILAGPQASSVADKSMKYFPYIDLIARGEGELYIEQLVENLITGRSLADVPGITYREGAEIIHNPDAPLLQDLDELPFYDEALFSKYPKASGYIMEVGRGCPYSCTFCTTSNFWHRKYRVKSINRIISEVKNAIDLYGYNQFVFNHDMFTCNRKYIIEFCNTLINLNLNINWACSARIDSLDEELVQKMIAAGCNKIYMGIETGSARMQKRIRKNLHLNEVRDKLKMIEKYNVRIVTSFIYGFDDETEEDLKDTLNLMLLINENRNASIQLHKLGVYAETPEYARVSDKLYLSNGYSDLSEIKFWDYYLPIIKQYPDIFSSYFDFNSVTRDEFEGIDTFIRMYTHLNKWFRKTLATILELHNQDILKLFLHFRDISNNIQEYLRNNNDIGEVYGNLARKQSVKMIETMAYDCFKDESFDVEREIFKFEKDCYEFISFDTVETCTKDYKYNIIALMKNISVDESNNSISIQIIRKGKNRMHIKRIA